MPLEPKKLDKTQVLALQEVTAKFRAHRDGRLVAEARIREEVERELSILTSELALAVRRAHEAGVPKVHIAKIGLNTTARVTVDKWLERTERLSAGSLAKPLFEWEDADARTVRVQIPDFATTVTSKDDYPDVLEGVAQNTENGWVVVSDPGTTTTATGELPGWFTWEIENGGVLPGMLDAWIEQQK